VNLKRRFGHFRFSLIKFDVIKIAIAIIAAISWGFTSDYAPMGYYITLVFLVYVVVKIIRIARLFSERYNLNSSGLTIYAGQKQRHIQTSKIKAIIFCKTALPTVFPISAVYCFPQTVGAVMLCDDCVAEIMKQLQPSGNWINPCDAFSSVYVKESIPHAYLFDFVVEKDCFKSFLSAYSGILIIPRCFEQKLGWIPTIDQPYQVVFDYQIRVRYQKGGHL